MLSRLITLIAAALLALGAHAAPTPIVDLAGVQAAVARGAILWDVRPAEAYRRGHLPGAVSIGDVGDVLRDPQSEELLPPAKIEKIFAAAGLDPSQEIIVYAGRSAPPAYYGRFALRYFGAQNVSVFHDGVDGWVAAGLPLERKTSRRPAIKLKLAPQPQLNIETDALLARLQTGGVQLIDARTPGEYHGEVVRAARGGHIPGATNIPVQANWVDPEVFTKLAQDKVADSSGAALAPAEKLKALYSAFDPEKETIVYCQSGMRAAETATVLEAIGFHRVRVYDASWLGYAKRQDAPLAQ
ncbi:MAG: hypothetical protein CVU17_08925 [Betaproteobacteria bacterium HGW-Betaproteobacteria-11]|nr:MAG: hypothetical protein CVU17_08925 [Betaproteobacteria bacterium HGW-Betaproteobacteria-11]